MTRGVVLHAKFAAYLAWSQPFLHRLITGLEPEAPGAILCNRREHRERFPLPRYACATTQALLRPAGAALVAEALRRAWQPRLLHAHFGWSGIRSLLLRECLDVPLVTTFGGRDLGSDLRDPLHAPLYRRLLQATDLCVCVSDTLAGLLEAEGVEAGRIRLIRRGADTSYFEVVDRAGRSDGPLRLLMMGRLVEKKGHGDALEALAALRAEGVDAVLRVVGAGDRAPIADAAARLGVVDGLELVEPTDAAGVRDHFAWADVLVHCSRRAADGDVEGIPNVVVEAAATGLPVVGTRHGGIPEVVRDGETGALVPEGDAKALASALAGLARGRDQRLAMGAAGARRVREGLTLAAQVEAHLAAYDALEGVTARAAPLPPAYTREALAAVAPAIDADLLVASRWLRGHWVAAPARPASSPAPPSAAVPPASSRETPAAPAVRSPREELRRFGAAWAERPVLGLPMRGYRAIRRAWVAAAQRREDARAWDAVSRGLRPDLSAEGARRAIRRVLKEGPAADG